MANKSNRGNASYQRVVDTRKGPPCVKLKRHYRGCAREVIGWFENMAERDEERFVFARPSTVAQRTKNKNNNYQPFSPRAVDYAISLGQKDRVLQQVRRFRYGAWRWGYLVAHHDTVAVRGAGQCDFKGQRHWEREIKTVRQPDGNWKLSSVGPVRWTEWATGAALKAAMLEIRHAEESDVVLPGAVKGALDNSQGAVQGAVNELAKAPQPDEEPTTSKADAPASLVSLSQSALETHNLTTPDSLVNPPQHMVAEKPLGGGVVEEGSKADDETILQHFGGQWGVLALTIEEIGAGRMVEEIWDEKVDYDVQRDLLKLCGEIISEFGAQPYLGLRTNAFIMDSAAKRYNAIGKQWPKCWLKVLHDLKRAGNTSLETTR